MLNVPFFEWNNNKSSLLSCYEDDVWVNSCKAFWIVTVISQNKQTKSTNKQTKQQQPIQLMLSGLIILHKSFKEGNNESIYICQITTNVVGCSISLNWAATYF